MGRPDGQIVIVRDMGDHTEFWVRRLNGPKWSPEYPDARLFLAAEEDEAVRTARALGPGVSAIQDYGLTTEARLFPSDPQGD